MGGVTVTGIAGEASPYELREWKCQIGFIVPDADGPSIPLAAGCISDVGRSVGAPARQAPTLASADACVQQVRLRIGLPKCGKYAMVAHPSALADDESCAGA